MQSLQKPSRYVDIENHPILSPWGEALREAMKRDGLRQDDLSAVSGVSQATISRNLNGALCGAETREKLIAALSMPAGKMRRAWNQSYRAHARAEETFRAYAEQRERDR